MSIVDDLRPLISEDTLRAFLLEYGGTEVLIPKRDDGVIYRRLVGIIGVDAVAALQNKYPMTKVYVPHATVVRRSRNAEILERLAAGESPSVIARSYRVVTTLTARHVRRIAAAAGCQLSNG